jgi:hypothetical protein
VLITFTLGLAGFVIAGLWLPGRKPLRLRIIEITGLAAIVVIVLSGESRVRPSWDLSENRRNSFPAADDAALREIHSPLHLKVFLAAEDPRLMDLDRNILSKLQRVIPDMTVEYAAHSRSGLFEGSTDHYGEVWYELGGRSVMSRSTTEPIVIQTLYKLAEIAPPLHSEESAYPGHPLAVHPIGAGWIYYIVWPIGVGLAAFFHFKRS